MSCLHLKKGDSGVEVCTCAPGKDPMVPSCLEKQKFCYGDHFGSCPVYIAFSPSKPINRFVCGYLSASAERV